MDSETTIFPPNRTRKYLAPCLKGYGDEFSEKLQTFNVVAYGIHDSYLDGTDISDGHNIHMVVDRDHIENLDWLRSQPYFITDYLYDDIETSKYQMVILTVPEEYENAYECFMNSEYSKMYTSEQIEFLFQGTEHTEAKAVLQKTAIGLLLYNNLRGSQDSVPNTQEFDFDMSEEEEVFNFNIDQQSFLEIS